MSPSNFSFILCSLCHEGYIFCILSFFVCIFLVGWFCSIMGLLIFKFLGVLASLSDRKWVSNGSYNGNTRVYCTLPDCVDTLRMPTMKAASSIFLNKVI